MGNEPHPPQKVSPWFENPHSEPFPRRDPNKEGSGVLMGNAQERLTLSHPSRQLPSHLKASPPHISGTSLLPTSEPEDVGSSAGPFYPRLTFRRTEAQGGWVT